MYVSNMKLLVDVGQLPASVLEEEVAVQSEGGCEDVYEEDSDVGENVRRIGSPDDNLEGNEKPKLAHEREGDGQYHGDRDDKSIGNHWKRPL